MSNNQNRETLLRVEHLCQYFGPTKAVDDVSFDIKKGEVFGLVGESGCGKTTTGRSIIKIYDITSGSIYFKNQRICAGALSYRKELREQKKLIALLNKEKPADAEERSAACKERIAQLRQEVKKADFDHHNSDKEYAKELGWDWRMLAAVIYQESKFSINSRSHRGAQGLMQVMPSTGRYYEVENLLDPEENIFAGTSHIRRLQNMFKKDGLEGEELIKFTLAAYNAGEGRIMDCRNLAASREYDNMVWDETVKVIPLMREDSILEDSAVKLGKFQGHETIAYVEQIFSHYNAFCEICPSI